MHDEYDHLRESAEHENRRLHYPMRTAAEDRESDTAPYIDPCPVWHLDYALNERCTFPRYHLGDHVFPSDVAQMDALAQPITDERAGDFAFTGPMTLPHAFDCPGCERPGYWTEHWGRTPQMRWDEAMRHSDARRGYAAGIGVR